MKGDYVSSDMSKPNSHKHDEKSGANGEAGRTLLIGLLGGLASAAGYVVYNRLPEEQKARLQTQVRGLVESRLSEIRSNFNI